MIKKLLIKYQTIILIFVEIILFFLGVWVLIGDITFITTKKEVSAKIIKIEKLQKPKPYKITLEYFNEYENKEIKADIDDISGTYGLTLPLVNNYVKIYYSKESQKIVYLVDYKYPHIGNLVIYLFFISIIIIAIIFNVLTLKKNVGSVT